jgi:glycosyltransferase involved in cell wall biosynthesis
MPIASDPASAAADMTARALVSIILTTYERPDALLRVLESLERQTDPNFEIIIADDGSGPATAAAVESFKRTAGQRVRHVWQEHRGFRAAESRNRAVAASAGDYLIFLDGDCLARTDFVAQHRILAEPGWFVAGNRALLSDSFTRQLLASPEVAADWSSRALPGWVGARVRGDVNRLLPLLRLPPAWPRKSHSQDWQGAKTCNLAMSRQDFLAVDGFDESYIGWGHEDADLVVRLIRSGVLRKEGRFATSVLHLWHAPAPRQALNDNEARLEKVLHGSYVLAPLGISRQHFGPATGQNGGLTQT